jgi:hypothetical protein
VYSSPNIIQVIKLKRMRWAGFVACMEDRRGEMHTSFWWGNLRERDHLEDPSIDGRVILRKFFRKWVGGGHGLD